MASREHSPPPYWQERISAGLDGELDAQAQAELEAHLRSQPEDAAWARALAADREALRARAQTWLHEPVPPALQALVWGASARQKQPAWALAAAAAGLLLAGLALGGYLGAQGHLAALGLQAPATASLGQPWPERAAVAHAVYVPEKRHPVEVAVAAPDAAKQREQEEHLARWLTRRLDLPVKLFDLRAQGFALVGGRLLPDVAQPGAQLMYENPLGERVTVYLRRPERNTPAAFRFQQQGRLGMFYWVDSGAGYALVGELPRERLLAMAESIYEQCPSRNGGAFGVPANKP